MSLDRHSVRIELVGLGRFVEPVLKREDVGLYYRQIWLMMIIPGSCEIVRFMRAKSMMQYQENEERAMYNLSLLLAPTAQY